MTMKQTAATFAALSGRPPAGVSGVTEQSILDADQLPSDDEPLVGAKAAFEECLAGMPQAGSGRGFNDQALPRAARLAKIASISAEEAIKRIHATQRGATRETEAEI